MGLEHVQFSGPGFGGFAGPAGKDARATVSPKDLAFHRSWVRLHSWHPRERDQIDLELCD